MVRDLEQFIDPFPDTKNITPILFLLLLYFPVYGDAVYFNQIPVSLPISANYLLIGIVAVAVIVTRATTLPTRESILGLLALGGLVFYLGVTSIWSLSESYATWKALRAITIVPFLAGVVILYFEGQRRRIRALYAIAILTAVILSIEGLYTFVLEGRGYSANLGVNYILHSRPLGIGALLCLYFVSTEREWRARSVFIGIFALALITMLQTGARGPLLSLGLAMVLYLAWVIVFTPVEIMPWHIGGAATAIVFGAGALTLVAGSTVDRMVTLVTWNGASSASGRVDLWLSSVQYWTDAPILGHGIGSFAVLYSGEDIRSYPHNIILELGVEGGLIAVLLFAIFSGWCLLCAIRTRYRDPYLIGITVALWMYLLLNAMVTGDLSTNRMLFAGSALLLAVSKVRPYSRMESIIGT